MTLEMATMSQSEPPSLAVAPSALPASPPPEHAWRAKLRWFFAEFVIVVAGILVALALDSWAGDRREQQRERVYLQQLSADLQSSETELAEAVDFLRQRAHASARVLHRFWRMPNAVDETLVDDLSLPRTTRRFRPVLGTVQALSSSSDLGLVHSESLRADLLTYVESMNTHLADIERYDETYYRPATMLLYRGPDLFAFAKFSITDDKMLPRPNAFERVPFPTTLAEMLQDHDVYVGYNFLLIAHRNQASGYEDMLVRTKALRSKVDAALAD
jgi:hypothetical protein